jgi:hypothetical protein
MQKTKLNLVDYYNLEAELNGVVNQQNGEIISKGLLSEKIKLTTKYWISDVAKKVKAEKDACEAIKEELIKKHGEADENGSIGIAAFINVQRDEEGNIISGENNPKYLEFQKEWIALLNEEKELEHKEFKLEEFEEVSSEGAYLTFFKLIKTEE